MKLGRSSSCFLAATGVLILNRLLKLYFHSFDPIFEIYNQVLVFPEFTEQLVDFVAAVFLYLSNLNKTVVFVDDLPIFKVHAVELSCDLLDVLIFGLQFILVLLDVELALHFIQQHFFEFVVYFTDLLS